MRIINNMKIGKRLLTAFLIVSIITGIVGVMGFYGMSRLKSTSDDMYSQQLVSLPILSNTLTSISSIQSASRDATINYNNPNILLADKVAFEKST